MPCGDSEADPGSLWHAQGNHLQEAQKRRGSRSKRREKDPQGGGPEGPKAGRGEPQGPKAGRGGPQKGAWPAGRGAHPPAPVLRPGRGGGTRPAGAAFRIPRAVLTPPAAPPRAGRPPAARSGSAGSAARGDSRPPGIRRPGNAGGVAARPAAASGPGSGADRGTGILPPDPGPPHHGARGRSRPRRGEGSRPKGAASIAQGTQAETPPPGGRKPAPRPPPA